MPPGRKPIPTAIKIQNGNPGKRALNLQEPQPEVAIPECPSHLDELAREEWDRVTQELHTLGVLALVDRSSLAGYCVAWSRWVQAETKLQDEGYVLQGQGGGYYQNPMLAVANKAMEQLYKFASEFGMTPSSRTRIKANPAESKASSNLLTFVQQRTA